MSKEQDYRKALADLRKSYIAEAIKDLNKGWDLSLLEVDGYQSYLMVSYPYRDLPNQEAILQEFGLTVDHENHALKLDGIMLDSANHVATMPGEKAH